MYDELINRLRDCTAEQNGEKTLWCQAADAIEELSILAENGETAYDIMVRQTSYIEELQKKIPRWIPVTERLPRTERESYWVCTDTGYQCEARWTNNVYGFLKSNNHEWGWSIADVPQYQKVVAWRVLPQPYTQPKEE